MSYPPPPMQPHQPPPPPMGGGAMPPYGGGGAMPPYGNDGGMPAFAGGAQPAYSPIDAVKYGWTKFTQNAMPFIVVTAIVLILNVGIQVATNLAMTGSVVGGSAIDPDTGLPENFVATQLVSLLTSLIGGAVTWVLGLALVRGALDVVDTGRTDLSAMFTRIPWGQALLVGLLVALATFVGALLCVFPGIVVGFLLYYSNIAVVDGHPAIEGITASYRFTTGHLAETLLLALLAFTMIVLSFCTLGIALLAVIPLLSIAAVYTWRVLQGRPVAP